MSDLQHNILVIASHPVQYVAPVFRLMAQHPALACQVAYCSLQGAEVALESEFGVPVVWDVPLLEGYAWIEVKNSSWRPGLHHFWGLWNPGLWSEIRSGHYDAIVLYTGYTYASFWLAVLAAKLSRTAVLFNTDATTLRPRNTQVWKQTLKQWVLPWIFRLADTVIVPSTATQRFIQTLGIPLTQIGLTPFVVDNDWWLHQSAQIDPGSARQQWGLPETAIVILFCAKLQPWKRPQDALEAFAQVQDTEAYLLLAGEGPLRAELEAKARSLGVAERVKFLGFINQSQLPQVYRAANIFLLPSEYEPFGVVVNEAMLSGCVPIVSDRVGAGADLVEPGKTGFIYPCGEVAVLSSLLRQLMADREQLQQLAVAAQARLQTWSPRENVEGLIQAVTQAVGRVRRCPQN